MDWASFGDVLMGPIDYSGAFGGQSPLQAFTDSLKVGAGVRDLQMQQQAQAQQQAAQQAMQAELASVARNPTPQSIAQLSIRYPQFSEHFKRANDMLQPAQQQATLARLGPIYAAAQAGATDLAQRKLIEHATALENSGMAQDAKEARDMAELVGINPGAATTSLGGYLASILGPDKFATTFGQLGAETRATQQAPADLAKKKSDADTAAAEARIKAAAAAVAPQSEQANLKTKVWNNANTRSQIEERSKRLALDKDKLTSEVKLKLTELGQKANTLDDGAKKLVNDNTVAAVAADQSAGQMLDLANRIGQIGTSWGTVASAGEWLKKALGNQDAVTQLRQEYVRLRSTQVSKMLPPGPASDKDIQLALSGFPPDTADPQTMAAFVRGMAKLQQYDAALSTAKAEWVNSVGHLGKPKTDIEVDGVKVPAGATFPDFAKQFVQRKSDARAAEQSSSAIPAAVQSRGYMRFATPGQ
jgi:hypothetical protein